MADKSWYESMRSGIQSEEQVALEFLFPAANRMQKLQMLGEITRKQQMPLTVLGVLRREYKSKLLTTMQEELIIQSLPLDRKSRLEASEIVAAVRRPKEGDDD